MYTIFCYAVFDAWLSAIEEWAAIVHDEAVAVWENPR
jgi:hypothetical protein